MPTRNVNLTEELERFVLEDEAKLAALGSAIDEGEASGVAEGNAFDRVTGNIEPSQSRMLAAPAFRHSRRAEAGLFSIAQYTLRIWGEEQTVRYIDALRIAHSGVRPIKVARTVCGSHSACRRSLYLRPCDGSRAKACTAHYPAVRRADVVAYITTAELGAGFETRLAPKG
jgi:hypothetical protein